MCMIFEESIQGKRERQGGGDREGGEREMKNDRGGLVESRQIYIEWFERLFSLSLFTLPFSFQFLLAFQSQ